MKKCWRDFHNSNNNSDFTAERSGESSDDGTETEFLRNVGLNIHSISDNDNDSNQDITTNPQGLQFQVSGILRLGNPGAHVLFQISWQPNDYFNMIVNDELFVLIVKETNDYSNSLKCQTSCPKIDNNWKTLSRDEFKIFIDLLLHTRNHLPWLNSYCSTHWLWSIS